MIKYITDYEEIFKLISKFETCLTPTLSDRNISIVEYASKICDNGVCLLAVDGCEAGIVCFYSNDYNTKKSYLTFLAVDENLRGKGYGKILMKEMENKSKQSGMKMVQLEVHKNNKKGIQFYEKLGYKIESEKNHESYYMTKKI